MNKAAVIQKILKYSGQSWRRMSGPQSSPTPKRRLKKTARKTNTHPRPRASYLAAGQANKVAGLESALETFEGLKEQPASDAVEIGSLIELQQDGFVEWYFVGPTSGGTEIEIDGTEVLVITPESPLGSQIMGLEAGAKDSLELGGRTQKAVVQAVL